LFQTEIIKKKKTTIESKGEVKPTEEEIEHE
jgi:hypothetical protein